MEFAVGLATVFVSDFERALEFYDIALGLPLQSIHEASGRAVFGTEGAHLALEWVAGEQATDRVGRDTGIVLLVPDVAAAHGVLEERGVRFTVLPSTSALGVLEAQLEDPDGNRMWLRQR